MIGNIPILFVYRAVTTKQCTGYVPHKPSIYEFIVKNETLTESQPKDKNFILER
jgi:hypothetical protein